eukprot:2896980-Pyramimonas_sp.AAC.1
MSSPPPTPPSSASVCALASWRQNVPASLVGMQSAGGIMWRALSVLVKNALNLPSDIGEQPAGS